jgi:hypothetical protein
MKERERLIQEALIETDKKLIDKSKQIPQKPIMIGDEYSSVLSCVGCKQPIVNIWNCAEYKPQYCHYCG